MTKIVLIISMLALLAAGGIAVVNRSKFVSMRTEKDEINAEIKRIKDRYETEFEEQFVTVGSGIDEQVKLRVNADAKRELAVQATTASKAELATEMAKAAPLNDKIAEYQRTLDELQARFPGVTEATLSTKIAAMEKKSRDLIAAQETLRAESEMLSNKVESLQSVVSRHVEKQEERAVGVARNATTPVITAVNQQWGFVIINGGSETGITKDSRLLATRNGQVLSRLNVVSVEPNQTVANIDGGTLAEGAMVLPGDTVIFQNLQQ